MFSYIKYSKSLPYVSSKSVLKETATASIGRAINKPSVAQVSLAVLQLPLFSGKNLKHCGDPSDMKNPEGHSVNTNIIFIT